MRRDGWAPLFLESVMEPALAHLADALRPDAIVLDLGSGSGHVADAVRACGGRTICVDVDRGVLEASRQRYPGGDRVAADAARLPLADASVDAVFCFSVLQYTDRDAALAEIRRVLRPGGRVVVVENLAGSPVGIAYRAWRAIVGIRYPSRLTPVHHLSWRNRTRMLRHFPGACFDAWYLTSAVLLVVPQVYNADDSEPPGSPLRRILGAALVLDSFLMRTLPWLRHGAWMLLMRG